MDDPDLLQLPGGSWIARAARPCGCCGATLFDVVRVRRKVTRVDGPPEMVEAVEVRCPSCPLLTDKGVTAKTTLGTFDTATGTLTISLDPGAPRP